MRNLVLLGEKRRTTTHDSHVIVDLCRVPSDDGTSCHFVLLTANGLLTQVHEYTNEILWQCHLKDSCENDGSNHDDEWFDVTFVDSDQVVCLSRGGAIVTVSPTSGVAEVVGEFDNGLEAGQWSPDREVLLLVTFVDNEEGGKNSVLLSMNAEWEVLAETTIESHVPYNSTTTGEQDSSVQMCWRPDATLCAVSTVDVVDQTRRIRTYKKETLDLNSVGRSEDGSGKVVPNLLPQIAWASVGCSNLLTSVQRKGKRTQQVVFFEPNGLRHREFPLRPEQQQQASHATVLSLDWNVESDLLAVSLREPTHDKVQLWHRSNYHWYLKQELRYDTNQQITCVKFDEEKPYILYVALSEENVNNTDSEWREYEFQWDTSTLQTSMDPSSPMCTAVSIDGCTLNLTPLDKALVPPPMYAASLTMDNPVCQVAFSLESSSAVRAVAYLSDGSFAIMADTPDNKSQLIANYSAPTVVGKVTWTSTEKAFDATCLRQILIVKSSDTSIDLIAIAPCASPNYPRDCLVELQVELDGSGNGVVSVKNIILMEDSVLRMIHWLDCADGALLQLNDGALLEYSREGDSGEGQVLPSEAEPLLEPCPWISALYDASVFDQGEGSHRQRLVVGLSARLRLYCLDRLLADAASSFILSLPHQFLCFATADARSVLKSLPIKELHNFDPLMGSDENYLLEGYEPRNVERGTRLVAILPMNPMAVLQMPRGNMEGIYPRSLVLPFVMAKIDKGEYGEAFSMMRRQKVDLNLIVDLDPVHFLESKGVETFLEQVIPVDYLNLFISCLQDVDITQFRYRIPEWFERKGGTSAALGAKDFDFTTKVNQICRRLRTIMIQAERDGQTLGGRAISDGHFLLPILSTFAKESPPKLEEALSLIKDSALAVHPPSSRKPPLFGEKAQSSIQYLAFLADYEMLFNTALGMYDYELARAVARNSQMDPKVYLPFLKRLKSCPKYYGQYEVDVRLERYEAALSNLVKSGTASEDLASIPPLSADQAKGVGNDFEHCMALIDEHGLHRLGLELFHSDVEKHREIMLSLGNHLMEKKQAKTALGIFLAADPPLLDGARQAARQCGDWKFFFTLPAADGTDDSDESADLRNRRLAHEIANDISARQVGTASQRTALADAARILLEYSQDVVGAIDMLISAQLWSEGRRIATLHSRPDLVKKCVDAATSYAGTCLEDFEERTELFKKANERYAEVLKIRKAAIRESGLAPGEEHDPNMDDSGSLFSMASNASLRSNMSGSSVGSVSSSVSSVITVGAQSTFSISTNEDAYKHKSKFNKLGKEKKKRKKRSRNKRARPGSEEELKGLVNTLRFSHVDASYCEIIAETIEFLAQVGRLELARDLFDGFNAMKTEIAATQKERMDVALKEKEEHERKSRREGIDEPFLVHEAESEVDGFSCAELPDTLHDVFSYLKA
jgi:elongator complex protein 1